MKQSDRNSQQFAALKSSLSGLIAEYKETRTLIDGQIEAVITSDLARLETLTEQQIEKYDVLARMEKKFKDQLKEIFQNYCPDESGYSVTRLLQHLNEPSEELNQLRQELAEQVKRTQQLKDHLVELLSFARLQNMETFERIYRGSRDDGESYDADGKKKKRSPGSVAINQKA